MNTIYGKEAVLTQQYDFKENIYAMRISLYGNNKIMYGAGATPEEAFENLKWTTLSGLWNYENV